MDLTTLADLPDLKGSAAKPRSTITIGRLDDNLRDPRYGKFAITQKQVDGWKRNLSDTFGGQVSMDFDHSSDRGNGTRAACWITSIDQTGTANGSLITADVQFTKAGAKAVRNGDYKYTSPTFVENYVDEHGQKHGPALIGGALTNRPVLRKGMPCLSLSRDAFEGVATPASGAVKERKRARQQSATVLAANPEPARDSRAQMDRTELLKALALDESADQVTILAAVAKLTAPADGASAGDPGQAKPKSSKKARKAAKKTMAVDTDGNVILSAEGLAALELAANAGAAAATQLAEQSFNHAWQKALEEGRAAPSQEANLRELHKLDPEMAVKTLDSFVKIVPTTPAGSGEAGAAAGQAPAGMDDERYQLHTEAKALAATKLAADPHLDAGEAYILAAEEIEERKFALEYPGI